MKASKLRQKTCCFTGHRDLPEHKAHEIKQKTINEVRYLIVNKGVRFFGVGGAIGYDTLAAEVLFRLRETEFPSIKVILAYPYEGFTSRWTPTQRTVYNKLFPNYDKVVCVSDVPSRAAYLARDRHLVNSSAYCIAYCTRNQGGTAYTIRYAKPQGVEVRNIETITYRSR